MSIKIKIMCCVIAPVIMVAAVLLFISRSAILSESAESNEKFEKLMIDQKKVELSQHVQIAFKAVEKFYNDSMSENIGEALRRKGTEFNETLMRFYQNHKDRTDEAQLKAMIIDFVESYRFDNSIGYFWINDFQPKMIMHPIVTDLNGKDLKDYKDPNGVYLFNEMIEVCRGQGAGFVKYQWLNPKSGKVEDKISYVFIFKPFNWILGTGEYLSVLKERLQNAASETIRNLRYGEDGYFWINNLQGWMIMHPIKSANLEGKDTSGLKDPNGKLIIMEMVDVCKKQGEGRVEYYWPRPGSTEPSPKLAFVKQFPEWGWIIGTGAYIDDIYTLIAKEKERTREKVNALMLKNIMISGGIVIVILLLTGIFITHQVNNPLERITTALRNFNNDLTTRIDQNLTGEFGDLMRWFNGHVQELRETVTQVAQSVDETNSYAANIAEAVADQASVVAEQSASVSEISSTMDEFSTSSGKIAENSNTVVEIAQNTLASAHDGARSIDLVMEKMDKINSDNQKNVTEIAALRRKTDEITKVMGIINNIADQTKLIAFNAAIEASGAGESGKRFGVVAAEIRRLADNVMESTDEIDRKINEIQEAANQMVIASEASTRGIHEGMSSFTETAGLLNAILNEAQATADAARQISLSTQQQKSATDQIVVALKEIAQGARQSSASIENISGISKKLAGLSNRLKDLMHKFKLS
jgi:methyl-accepting chemotaxis protein